MQALEELVDLDEAIRKKAGDEAAVVRAILERDGTISVKLV